MPARVTDAISAFRAKGVMAIAACLTLVFASAASSQVKVDEKLPAYRPIRGVSGNIKSVGSDTMNNLMTLWGEGFRSFYPSVRCEIEGKGSSTAPPALIAGTANFGPMSREMESKEIDEFNKKYGYKPTPLPTSIDMLAVYVHRDNPIASLSLQQLDAMYSSTRKRGLVNDIKTWGDLGLTGNWADQSISLYGRNSASGTYKYFGEHVLLKGSYKGSVKEQPGSSSVVQGVASDKYGIGYSGIGYKTADVKIVPLSIEPNSPPIAAEPKNAYSGTYPLARFLYLYVNNKPGGRLDPLRSEFIRYVYSRQGQEVVLKDGYLPVTTEVAAAALKSVGAAPKP